MGQDQPVLESGDGHCAQERPDDSPVSPKQICTAQHYCGDNFQFEANAGIGRSTAQAVFTAPVSARAAPFPSGPRRRAAAGRHRPVRPPCYLRYKRA